MAENGTDSLSITGEHLPEYEKNDSSHTIREKEKDREGGRMCKREVTIYL